MKKILTPLLLVFISSIATAEISHTIPNSKYFVKNGDTIEVYNAPLLEDPWLTMMLPSAVAALSGTAFSIDGIYKFKNGGLQIAKSVLGPLLAFAGVIACYSSYKNIQRSKHLEEHKPCITLSKTGLTLEGTEHSWDSIKSITLTDKTDEYFQGDSDLAKKLYIQGMINAVNKHNYQAIELTFHDETIREIHSHFWVTKGNYINLKNTSIKEFSTLLSEFHQAAQPGITPQPTPAPAETSEEFQEENTTPESPESQTEEPEQATS